MGRMNKILRKSYDPVRVKLLTNEVKNKKQQPKKTKKKKPKKPKHDELENKMAEIDLVVSRSLAETEDKLKVTENATNRAVQSTATIGTGKAKKQAKPKPAKKVQKARATLFGLSSLRRDGDVSVNLMADYTTVKTNFIIGPLTLKVEKEVRNKNFRLRGRCKIFC